MSRRWLVLRLTAPLMSFGAVAVDHVGPSWAWPGRSMLTGLFANALGWDWTDRAVHQRLQDRLVHAAAAIRPGEILTDIQNAQLAKLDRGWTTRGQPEGRTGASYDAPHRRRRDYLADADLLVVATLQGDGAPDLDAIADALDRPARPLVLGRKPCLPSGPLARGEVTASTAHAALAEALGAEAHPAAWPEDEGPIGDRTIDLPDLRIWTSGLHGGSRRLVEGTVGRVP